MRLFCLLTSLLLSISAWSQSKFEVFFDFNKDVPNSESMIHLRNWTASNPKAKVLSMFGYCDSVDNNEYNRNLAMRRIRSVIKILSESGVAVPEDIQVNPYGEEFTQSPVQAENRKVAIFYEQPVVPMPVKQPELTELVRDSRPGDIIRLQNMNFFNNSPVMVPKSKPVLEELLCIMNENPNLKIEIQGHICCQLERDINGISTARARTVYVFLVRNGINKKRLSYKGYGSTRPLHPIPEESSEQEDDNRRVEIRIVEN